MYLNIVTAAHHCCTQDMNLDMFMECYMINSAVGS